MIKLDKIEGIFRNLDEYLAVLRDLAQVPEDDLK